MTKTLMNKLSIVIPVYNEKNTILEILKRVEEVKLALEKEIILVDDCSTDGTREILQSLKTNNHKIYYQLKNSGKGAAVRRGFDETTGNIIIIQDADLEYNPADYPRLIKPILDGRADIVYGSRFLGSSERRVLYFWHSLANKFLTILANIFSGLNLSDMETGYKIFSREALNKIKPRLTSNRFGIEPEITILAGRNKMRVFEIGISYDGRTYAEGKKINWRDGLAAVWQTVKFGLRR